MRAVNPGGGGALATEAVGAGGGAADSAARVGARITALVPVKHYHPVYLEQCLRSLAAQTCAAWRCLVVRDWFAARVFRGDALVAQWLDLDVARRWGAEHQSGGCDVGRILWSLVVLEAWAQRFLAGDASTGPAA